MMSDIYEFFNTESVTAIVNRPTGGAMFHYSWSEDVKKDDWKADGYRWRSCGSVKDRKCGSGLCDRMYFQVYDGPKSFSKCFTKTAYFRRDCPNSVIISYNGDDKVAADFPHGNATVMTRNYIRTKPSVLRSIASTENLTPAEVYRSMVTQPILPPRNIEQVRNTLKANRNRGRLSRDALFNLHEFAFDSDFIQRISTYPDLEVGLK